MILCIGEILNADQLKRVRAALDNGSFDDGRKTAGWHARLVKNNEQMQMADDAARALRAEVEKSPDRTPGVPDGSQTRQDDATNVQPLPRRHDLRQPRG